MATIVKNISKVFFVEDENGYEAIIYGFEEGFVSVQIPINVYKYKDKLIFNVVRGDEFVEFLSGAFKEGSNFKEKICEAYGYKPDTEFLGFKMKLAGITCTITKENSSFYTIKSAIEGILDIYSKALTEEVKQKMYDFNKEQSEFDELINSLDVIFKSDRAEAEYEENFGGRDLEVLAYGQDFVAYVQYLIRQGIDNVSEAVKMAYKKFDSLDNNITEGLSAIKFVCQYCLYGDEIFKSYFNILMQKANDEIDKL